MVECPGAAGGAGGRRGQGSGWRWGGGGGLSALEEEEEEEEEVESLPGGKEGGVGGVGDGEGGEGRGEDWLRADTELFVAEVMKSGKTLLECIPSAEANEIISAVQHGDSILAGHLRSVIASSAAALHGEGSVGDGSSGQRGIGEGKWGARRKKDPDTDE
jgi:hypothetical protein